MRTRTLILVLTVGFVSLSLFITVVVLRQVLITETAVVTDRSLRTQGQEINRILADAPEPDATNRQALAEQLLTDYFESEVTGFNKTLAFIEQGQVIASVGLPLDGLSPTVAELGQAAETDTVQLVDGSSDQGPLRVLSRPVQDGGPFDGGALIIALSTEDRQGFIDQAFRDGIIVAIGTLLLMFPLAWLVAGRVLRPVELLSETAQDITAHETSQRLEPQGTAEMAYLIDSFNAMVDRLETAVREQRRFLNDASHELRTPLTVMRGHIEVARQDPTKATGATAVALTELDRMGRIVDDLLVLARAKEVDFLRIGPVDSDDFLSSIMTRVAAMSDHRWVIDAMPLGVFHADQQRLDQVALNLAANAARHTPVDGEIGIGAELAKDRFRLWVRDTGEGIDPAEHQQIFERFRRGSTQRSPGGGAGLGLSIVRAIAEAHHGTVSVESAPGEGSRFTVEVPALPPSPPRPHRAQPEET
jgi:signal transduction histidine kinase